MTGRICQRAKNQDKEIGTVWQELKYLLQEEKEGMLGQLIEDVDIIWNGHKFRIKTTSE